MRILHFFSVHDKLTEMSRKPNLLAPHHATDGLNILPRLLLRDVPCALARPQIAQSQRDVSRRLLCPVFEQGEHIAGRGIVQLGKGPPRSGYDSAGNPGPVDWVTTG